MGKKRGGRRGQASADEPAQQEAPPTERQESGGGDRSQHGQPPVPPTQTQFGGHQSQQPQRGEREWTQPQSSGGVGGRGRGRRDDRSYQPRQPPQEYGGGDRSYQPQQPQRGEGGWSQPQSSGGAGGRGRGRRDDRSYQPRQPPQEYGGGDRSYQPQEPQREGEWRQPQSSGGSWGRGRGRGGPQRGRGRGTPEQTRSGARPKQLVSEISQPKDQEQVWAGAKPKQLQQVSPDLPELLQTMSLDQIKEKVSHQPGTKGCAIKIESNHVRLDLGNLTESYRYDVSIEPEKKPKRMLRKALQLFQKTYFPNNNPSYDGQKLLHSAKKLPLQDDTISGKVNLELEQNKFQEFKITIKLTGTVDLTLLKDLLQKKNVNDAFQVVETVLRQAYTNSFINVGRRFYVKSSGNDYNLGGGAQMYLGGYQAMVKGYIPFLNVDVAHKAFTKPISIPDLIVDMFSTRNRPITDLRSYSLQRWQMEQMTDYLKGLKVIYQIPNHPGSKKSYKVNGLANIPSQEKFKQDNQMTTVEQYFREKWHCNFQYPKLPTLWVGNQDKRICVPMEFCVLQEGQPIEGSRMLGSQTSQMIGYSATNTMDRKKKIQDIMRSAGHNTNQCIEEFGFKIGTQFEPIEARVLPPPDLQYSDGKVTPNNGTWQGKKFTNGATINRWVVVGFGVYQDRLGRAINDLMRQFPDFGRHFGVTFGKPDQPEYIRDGMDQRSLFSTFDKKKNYDLIIVVFQNKDSYPIIKQVAELQIGCLTQCLKSETVERKLNPSTIGNILLKINCKMNGINHKLCNLDLISTERTMVMGADVTHPSPQAKNIPSVVAVTASHDLAATQYNISVYLQKPRTEILQTLRDIMVQKLRMFFDKNGNLPQRIYFFRDGVSEGEFAKVRETEVVALLQACDHFRKGYKPKLTFLVVQKRHHTRFFPTNDPKSCGDRKNFNVPVGTCVDTVIVDPEIQNFYLVSHQSIRGVARPTKYCTLFDDNELTNDAIQQLSYYLCHLFTRCNRAVSYPAPTYFAHLAADRAKSYLFRKTLNMDNLDQRLIKINDNFAQRNPMFFS